MAFDGILIHHLCYDIKSKLIGGRIDKIHQPESDELAIYIRGFNANYQLFISVESAMPYFTLTENKKENPLAPPMFCMLMRKHLTGGRITAIEQIGHERIVYIDIEAKNELGDLEQKRLYIEIMGKHSNLILTKENGTIIDCIKRITPDMSRVRTVLPGLVYQEVPSSQLYLPTSIDTFMDKLSDIVSTAPVTKLFKCFYTNLQGFSPFLSRYLLNEWDMDPETNVGQLRPDDLSQIKEGLIAFTKEIDSPRANGYLMRDQNSIPKVVYFKPAYPSLYSIEAFDHLYNAIDAFFSKSNKALKMHQRVSNLKKTVSQRIDRSVNKLAKLKAEQAEAENADHYKIKGELLLANIYRLSKGMNAVSLENYYNENEPLDIALDVRLEPAENAQKYFKTYNKLKHAADELIIQIDETEKEVDYLENVQIHLEQIETQSEIEDIINELSTEGIIKSRYKQKQKKTTKQTYRTYKSTEGMTILVGKNNVQNDQLTLKYASNKDIWLHTKIIPGSHVIIRTEGQEPSEQTLFEAAKIAAYHSKARESSNVPVEYTEVKYVTKPSGAKPGMVIYTHNKTLYVTPDETEIKKLKISD